MCVRRVQRFVRFRLCKGKYASGAWRFKYSAEELMAETIVRKFAMWISYNAIVHAKMKGLLDEMQIDPDAEAAKKGKARRGSKTTE